MQLEHILPKRSCLFWFDMGKFTHNLVLNKYGAVLSEAPKSKSRLIASGGLFQIMSGAVQTYTHYVKKNSWVLNPYYKSENQKQVCVLLTTKLSATFSINHCQVNHLLTLKIAT